MEFALEVASDSGVLIFDAELFLMLILVNFGPFGSIFGSHFLPNGSDAVNGSPKIIVGGLVGGCQSFLQALLCSNLLLIWEDDLCYRLGSSPVRLWWCLWYSVERFMGHSAVFWISVERLVWYIAFCVFFLEKLRTGSKRKPKDEHAKDGIQRKNVAGSSIKESSPDLKSESFSVGGSKAKKLAKDRKPFGVADDGKNIKVSPEEQAKGKLSGWKKGTRLGPAKHESVINEVSDCEKKHKPSDLVNDGPKGSFQTNRKIDFQNSNVLDKKADNLELKRSASCLKTENRSESRMWTGSVSSNIPSDEDALPLTKRRIRFLIGSWLVSAASPGCSSLSGAEVPSLISAI
ncbi:ENHANCER OF AG-4 protein [Sarracenia purpurea var. burkii]